MDNVQSNNPQHAWFLTKYTHIDDSFGGVLQVDTNGEVDQIIHAVPSEPEAVNGPLPIKRLLVPILAFERRPAAQSVQNLLDRLQTIRFDGRLVHASFVQVLRQLERLRLRRIHGLLDHGPQLVLQLVVDDAEGRHGRLVVGDVGLLEEVPASELVEVLARIDAFVHILEHLRGGVDASFAQAVLWIGVLVVLFWVRVQDLGIGALQGFGRQVVGSCEKKR